jgi:hypothetical protein
MDQVAAQIKPRAQQAAAQVWSGLAAGSEWFAKADQCIVNAGHGARVRPRWEEA